MAQTRQGYQAGSWWQSALIFAIGGALFGVIALWGVQTLAALFGGGRLLQPGSVAVWVAFLIGWLCAGLVGYLLLRRLFRWSRGGAWLAIGGWLLGYLILWVLSRAAGVSLPIYLAFWLGFGLLCGRPLAGRTVPAPARRRSVAREGRQMIRTSQFGRIPGETVVLLTQHVRHATGPVLAALPADAQYALRDATVAAVLERSIRDWWENGNADGLTPQDIADLRSFVGLAAALVGGPLDEVGQAVYRVTLAALLDDWLANWNANGADGPPVRR